MQKSQTEQIVKYEKEKKQFVLVLENSEKALFKLAKRHKESNENVLNVIE